MDLCGRYDFLKCLNKQGLSQNGLDVIAFSKQQLLSVIDEIGYSDFRGQDYEVIGRLEKALLHCESQSAFWGLVFIDLWFCNNFGRKYWSELVGRDTGNIRFAIQTAYWVFVQSGSDGGPALVEIMNHFHCWDDAEHYILSLPANEMRMWWQGHVAPFKRQ